MRTGFIIYYKPTNQREKYIKQADGRITYINNNGYKTAEQEAAYMINVNGCETVDLFEYTKTIDRRALK